MEITMTPTSHCSVRITGDNTCKAFSTESGMWKSLINQRYYCCCSDSQKTFAFNGASESPSFTGWQTIARLEVP